MRLRFFKSFSVFDFYTVKHRPPRSDPPLPRSSFGCHHSLVSKQKASREAVKSAVIQRGLDGGGGGVGKGEDIWGESEGPPYLFVFALKASGSI